jgi:polyribonucleotide nucleotidyltransferase
MNLLRLKAFPKFFLKLKTKKEKMKLNKKIYKTELDGTPLSLEISELAGKANAAVLGHYGDTAVLSTVVMGKEDKAGDFFPLTVDYEERFYAAGKILGSRFLRRELRPSDEATLSARLIDSTIRPLFDHRIRREVQVTVTVIAYDEKNDPDVIALLATSTALLISDIPWAGPVAGVKFLSQKEDGEIDFQAFFAGPAEKINMIEFEGDETAEEKVIKLFEEAQQKIKNLVDFQQKIKSEIGKPKAAVKLIEPDPVLKEKVVEFIKDRLAEAVRSKKLGELKHELFVHLRDAEGQDLNWGAVDSVFESEIDHYVREQILRHNVRPDGRKLDEVRELYSEVGIFNRTHGSAIFIRGDTQILAVTTLASPAAEQLVENIEFSGKKRFILHYNFPAFSTGETGRSRGPGRREIGHGALAAKAIKAMIPSKDIFPYTIRVVCETLSSNGSSSMASVCSAILSLMDAGVPIKKAVAGIAIGLMIGENGEFKILTDIQGPEDHHGDMDFKVAGTDAGLTAIQMDVKIEGITKEIFEEALAAGKKARLQILEHMKKTLPAPREKISPFAPTILTLEIPVEKIGEVIGPGGKIINGIIAEAGGETSIDIEQTGKIYVSSANAESANKALAMVREIVREYKPGEIVEGKVIRILDFGAIIDLGGGRDGMIHISELKEGYTKKVEDVVRLGDKVKAKVIRVEPDGKIALSLKALR